MLAKRSGFSAILSRLYSLKSLQICQAVVAPFSSFYLFLSFPYPVFPFTFTKRLVHIKESLTVIEIFELYESPYQSEKVACKQAIAGVMTFNKYKEEEKKKSTITLLKGIIASLVHEITMNRQQFPGV